jgi:hypothetical protein
LEARSPAASGEVAAESAAVEAQRVDLGERKQMSDFLKVPAGEPIPLSVLSLDLDEPTNGWAASLAGRGVEVQIDDVGRLCISRSDAARLFRERREAAERQREAQARNDLEAERQRVAQLWPGIPADQVPDGMTAAQYMMAGDPDLRPRRPSGVAAFLDGDSMIMHPIHEPLEDAS